MPSHSPSGGIFPAGEALVSGPRSVIVTLHWSLLTTSSQWFTAIERNGLAPSLCLRQTRSTKGESDALSSSMISMPVLPLDKDSSENRTHVHSSIIMDSETQYKRKALAERASDFGERGTEGRGTGSHPQGDGSTGPFVL